MCIRVRNVIKTHLFFHLKKTNKAFKVNLSKFNLYLIFGVGTFRFCNCFSALLYIRNQFRTSSCLV